jgi:hypothetical protein
MERKFLPTPEVDGNNELMIYVNIYPLPAKKKYYPQPQKSVRAEDCTFSSFFFLSLVVGSHMI